MKPSKTEQTIQSDLKKIQLLEEKIEIEEHRLENAENKLLRRLDNTDKLVSTQNSLSRFEVVRSSVVRKLAKHKFIYSVLISLGVVLVWRGLWDISGMIPILSYPVVALGCGLLILWLTKQYSDID